MFSCWEKLAIEIQTSTCRVARCKHIRDRFVRLTAPAAPALSVHLGPAIQPSITDFALSGECECFIRQSAEIEQLFTEGRVVVGCGGGGTQHPAAAPDRLQLYHYKTTTPGSCELWGFPCFLRNWARSRNCIGAGLLRFENVRAIETNTPPAHPWGTFISRAYRKKSKTLRQTMM